MFHYVKWIYTKYIEINISVCANLKIMKKDLEGESYSNI